jgi:gamma-tubulin complex component 3
VKIERLLLRDLVSVLRGLNGEYLKFDEAQQAYVLLPDSRVSPLLSSLALELAKIGVAFRQTQRMLAFFRPECGLIAQGFRAGAEAELLEFHRMVALFESLVIESTDPARGMNLRRATAWFTVPARKLAFLKKVVEACQDVGGAPLLERVSRYRDHGNDNYRAIAQNLLAQMTRPYLRCLAEWVARGDLVDPHNELFIVQAKPLDASVSGQDAWHKLYHVAPERIPAGLFDEATVRRILLVGKTLNFAKVCDQHCEGKPGGGAAMEIEAMEGSEEAADEADKGDDGPSPLTLETLKRRLGDVQTSACSGLSRRLFAEFRLRDHLALLKDALLLGRADFAQALLDSLAECLSKPANAIFRHNLVGVLETCLQGTFASNGQADPLLGNVDVRLHEPSRDASGSHQFGWDIFSLDYRVPAPLDALLGGDAMREYARLSQYLWMEKRLEYTLNQSTRRLHGLHRISRLSAGRYARSVGEDVFVDYRRLQMLHQEALGLVAALASHSMDVVAGSWAWFEAQLDRLVDSDLDRIIAVHAAYIARIKASLVTCFSPVPLESPSSLSHTNIP